MYFFTKKKKKNNPPKLWKMEKGLLIWKEAPSFKNPLPNPKVTVMAWLSSPQKALFSRDFCVTLASLPRSNTGQDFPEGLPCPMV